MDTVVRRRLEMGRKALTFSRANPSSDAGYVAALAGLEQDLARADALATEQHGATAAERVATDERRALRDHIRRLLLKHVMHVAVAAAREVPGLVKQIRVPQGNQSYEGFRVAAGNTVTAAKAQEELLVRHGLSPLLVLDLEESLAKFDAATQRRNESRLAHMGARDGLAQVLEEVVRTVRVLDTFNRHRYQDDRQQLAAWTGASSIFGAAAHAAEPVAEEGQIKPAA